MEIINLADEDFQVVTEFLNETLPYDEFTVDLLKEQTTGDFDYDPALALVARDERIEGFILGIHREEGNFWSGIKVFAVREDKNSKEIGFSLLGRVEQELAGRGVSHIEVGRCPPKYFQPGVDPRHTGVVSLLRRSSGNWGVLEMTIFALHEAQREVYYRYDWTPAV